MILEPSSGIWSITISNARHFTNVFYGKLLNEQETTIIYRSMDGSDAIIIVLYIYMFSGLRSNVYIIETYQQAMLPA